MKSFMADNIVTTICLSLVFVACITVCPSEAEHWDLADTKPSSAGSSAHAIRAAVNPFYPDCSTGLIGYVNKEGTRMANIVLLLDIYDKENSKQYVAHVLTDSAGEFFVPLPPGNYQVNAVTRSMVPGYMGVQRGLYDDLRYRVEPNKIAGPIEVTYTKPVHIEGLQTEELLSADRIISWSCEYINTEYKVSIYRRVNEPRGCVQIREHTEVSEIWRTDTMLVIPASRFRPGHYDIDITARDATTKENVSWTNERIAFWVGAITRVDSNEEEPSCRISNAAINGVPEKLILVRDGQHLAAIKFHYPQYPTLMKHDEYMPNGTRYRVSDTISYESWYQGDGSYDLCKDNVIAGSGELIERLRQIPGIMNQYETDSTDRSTIMAGPLSIEWSSAFVVYARMPANPYEDYDLCQTEWTRLSEVDISEPTLQWVDNDRW